MYYVQPTTIEPHDMTGKYWLGQAWLLQKKFVSRYELTLERNEKLIWDHEVKSYSKLAKFSSESTRAPQDEESLKREPETRKACQECPWLRMLNSYPSPLRHNGNLQNGKRLPREAEEKHITLHHNY